MSAADAHEIEPSNEPGTVYEVHAAPAPEAAAPPPAAPRRLPPLWRNRNYMFLWGGQVVSTLGSSISGIVFPLLILSLTNSAAAAGIAGAFATVPYVLFSLPAGALVDRWNRKRVMVICDTGRALSLASVPIALFFGVLTIWQLYANAFIEGTLFVFFNLAEVAALPRVVAKQQLPAATAQNESSFATAALIGPSLGGFLYQAVGRALPFVLDAVSYAISVVSLLTIRIPFQQERAAGAPRNLRGEIMEGLGWLWNQGLIRYMAFLTGALNFVGAAMGLIIIVLARNMGEGEAAIGLIFSIGAIGAIIGSILGGPISQRYSFRQVITGTVWLQVILFPLFALAPNIFLLGAIAAVISINTPVYNVKQFSYRVALIPDALQGRVNSAFRLLAFGFQPLGSAVAGFLLQETSTTTAVLFFAAWQLIWGVLTLLNGHVRHAPAALRDQETEEAPAPAPAAPVPALPAGESAAALPTVAPAPALGFAAADPVLGATADPAAQEPPAPGDGWSPTAEPANPGASKPATAIEHGAAAADEPFVAETAPSAAMPEPAPPVAAPPPSDEEAPVANEETAVPAGVVGEAVPEDMTAPKPEKATPSLSPFDPGALPAGPIPVSALPSWPPPPAVVIAPTRLPPGPGVLNPSPLAAAEVPVPDLPGAEEPDPDEEPAYTFTRSTRPLVLPPAVSARTARRPGPGA